MGILNRNVEQVYNDITGLHTYMYIVGLQLRSEKLYTPLPSPFVATPPTCPQRTHRQRLTCRHCVGNADTRCTVFDESAARTAQRTDPNSVDAGLLLWRVWGGFEKPAHCQNLATAGVPATTNQWYRDCSTKGAFPASMPQRLPSLERKTRLKLPVVARDAGGHSHSTRLFGGRLATASFRWASLVALRLHRFSPTVRPANAVSSLSSFHQFPAGCLVG